MEIASLSALVDIHDVDHGVHDGGDVLAEALTVHQGVDRAHDLNFEVDLVLGLVVVRPGDDSDHQGDDQVQVVILGHSLQLLNHHERFLANLEIFLLRLDLKCLRVCRR